MRDHVRAVRILLRLLIKLCNTIVNLIPVSQNKDNFSLLSEIIAPFFRHQMTDSR